MINDELLKIWNSSTKVEQVKFEKSRLMLEMQSSIDSFNSKIKSRDRRDIIAALIVIPCFIYAAWTIPYIISKVASLLVVAWAIYVIFRLQGTKQLQPTEYSENYLTYLKKNKEYIKAQKKMLDSTFWWYIAPFLFCLLLFQVGFLGVPGKENGAIQIILGGVVLSIIIYSLNRRSSRKYYEPRIQKVEALIQTLEEIN